jgi:chromosome segregation ATPase
MRASSGAPDTRTKVTLKDDSTEPRAIEPPSGQLDFLAELPIPPPDIGISRQRAAELKLDILSLAQRLDILKTESARMKRTRVRRPELAHIQMQVRLLASESSLSQISDLINEFTETMRAISALRSTCMNAEKAVIHESQLRDYLLRETEQVSVALSFSDYVSKPMKRSAPPAIGHLQQEVDRLAERISAVALELEPPVTADAASYLSVFGDIAAVAEQEAALGALPTEELRAEVEQLQGDLAALTRANKEMERAIRRERQPPPEDPQAKRADFSARIAKLDAQLLQVREALLAGRANAEDIVQQVADLRSALPARSSDAPVDFSVDSTDEEMSDSTDQIAETLADRRDALEEEIAALREGYKKGKRQARAREAALTGALRVLSARLTSLQEGGEPL